MLDAVELSVPLTVVTLPWTDAAADQDRAGAPACKDAVSTVRECGRLGQVQADDVALHRAANDGVQVDAHEAVAGDQVAVASAWAADHQVVAVPLDEDPDRSI